MKKKISILLILFALGFSLFAQEEYADENKEFSFIIPEDWQCINYGTFKYNLVVGERIDNFTQNIVISTEAYKGSMKQYVASSEDGLKKMIPNHKLIKKGEFKNDNKIQAYKFVIENEYEIAKTKKKVRQYIYTFKNKDVFFICTASVLQKTSEEMEEVFDESMRSFKFLPKAKTEKKKKTEKANNN